MRYHCLACDYDGTLAKQGHVDEQTVSALDQVRASGRKLLIVTGRQVDDLLAVFPQSQLFTRIVAENGAVIYNPSTREVQLLATPPPADFVEALAHRGVSPLATGRVIVATSEPNGETASQVIRDFGLELQVIVNKGAVMVLPTGINKASGLARALDTLGLSRHNTVGIGDAENDHAFLASCECSVAVANALDIVKAGADLVTAADHGAGVCELIARLVTSDLAELAPNLSRHDFTIGRAGNEDVRLAAYDGGLLIAGRSGAGKSSIATLIVERLCESDYQFCVIDPEGKYQELSGAVAVRATDRGTFADEAMTLLERPSTNVVVSLFDMRLADRAPFVQVLLARLLSLRASTGRPHWVLVDEAHHLLPSSVQRTSDVLPPGSPNVAYVTAHPDRVARPALDLVQRVIAVGRDPQATFDAFFRTTSGAAPRLPHSQTDEGRLAWVWRRGAEPIAFRPSDPTLDRLRDRKYAEGELGRAAIRTTIERRCQRTRDPQ